MFLQDEKGYWREPTNEVQHDSDKETEHDPDKQRERYADKETKKDSGSKKKKKRRKTTKIDDPPKSDSVIIEPPIPPELQLPAPISDRRDEDDAPKSDAFVTIDPPIPPELQLPTPISDRTNELPEGDVYQGSIVNPITMTLDPDESHSLPQPPNHSESTLPLCLHLFHPCL